MLTPGESALSVRIGNKLRAIRQMRNLSQEGMAALLSLSVSGYAKIERGESDIGLNRLQEMSRLLGISTDDLFNFGNNVVFNQQYGVNNMHNGQQTVYQHDKAELEVLKTAVLDMRNMLERLVQRVEALEQSAKA